MFNYYIDTSTGDAKNQFTIVLHEPIQVSPNEYLKVKIQDLSFMNDNYNISASLDNNYFTINRTQLNYTPVPASPIVVSPIFNAIDFYQTAGGNTLSIPRNHNDGYETLENGTFSIQYHNTDITESSNTTEIQNVFDTTNLSQQVTLSQSKNTFWVLEDVLGTGYLLHQVQVSITHDGSPISADTTFTFRIAYSNDNVTYTDFTISNNEIYYYIHLQQETSTDNLTISIDYLSNPQVYKYYKIYFETNVSIPDGEYTWAKVRWLQNDYTFSTSTSTYKEVITIPDGFYNSTTFISTINTLLQSYSLIVSLNTTTNKLSFQNTNTGHSFTINNPADLYNTLQLELDNNLLKRIFGFETTQTSLPTSLSIIADNPINLLHHEKLIIATDLTFKQNTYQNLTSWRNDMDEGLLNILLWCDIDEPPYTIIKYHNYENLSYQIDNRHVKNINLYFYNEYKRRVDINKMLIHLIIEKINISS